MANQEHLRILKRGVETWNQWRKEHPADITNPKSSPLELQATVPNYMTPFVPIIQESEEPFSMFADLQNKHHAWVLDTLAYDTPSNLINALERAVVQPALERRAELQLMKAQKLRTRHIKDYI